MKHYALFVVALAAVLSGCGNLNYYGQTMAGQFGIMSRQQPIDDLLTNPGTELELKQKLHQVLRIRDFASRELGLPDNDSYRYYADIKRPYVVWNVFAVPALSMESKTWCFPIAGCVNYRGYFSEAAAKRAAARLEEQGYDVFVGGVPAYSTLGWLQDPVLNTVVNRPEADLAGLIFHELAHQTVYVRGDSAFNESFATAVEREGVRRWLEHNESPEELAAYQSHQERGEHFAQLVLRYRDRLKQLYESDLPEEEKLALKGETFAALREEYATLKEEWGGNSRYDRWFERDLNNAKLLSVAMYTTLVPAFQRLLEQHDGRLAAFYQTVAQLKDLSKEERLARLGAVDDVQQASEDQVPLVPD